MSSFVNLADFLVMIYEHRCAYRDNCQHNLRRQSLAIRQQEFQFLCIIILFSSVVIPRTYDLFWFLQEKEKETWQASYDAVKSKLEVAESNYLRAEIEVAKMRSNLRSS